MYYIGIDLGGTNIAAGIYDENLELLYKTSVPTRNERTDKEIVDSMTELAKQIMEHEGVDKKDVKSIGIGAPGSIDVKNGVVIYSNNIKFKDTPIRAWMEADLGIPVFIENDANCAALGEATKGATKDADHSVMITLGTGVGGGIIINKKIYSGFDGTGAEIGHTVINFDGEPCNCGRTGCWEAYSSATALIRQTFDAAKANPESILGKAVDGKFENVNGKTAFDAMREGCPVGTSVVEKYINYIAIGAADIINVFKPDMLVIGGGVSKEGDNLVKPLEALLEKYCYGHRVGTQIKIAQLGNDAGIIGAAALGKE